MAQQADTRLINTPAETFAIAPGGVDMRTGRYVYDETDLSIGGDAQAGGLALRRTLVADVVGHTNPFANLSHNWDIMLSELRLNIDNPQAAGTDYRVSIHFGGRSQTYQSRATHLTYQQMSIGPIGRLTWSGDRNSASVIYTYTAPDSAVATFRPLGGGDCSSDVRRCAYISELVEPDGTRYTFDYAASGSFTGGAARLRQVVSSRGHALLLEGSFNLVTKACVLNLALTTLPANGLCPANALATTSYAYDSGATALVTATGPDNEVESFVYGSGTMGFVRPGETVPWLTNSFFLWIDEQGVSQQIITAQSFADGRSYAYAYNFSPQTLSNPNPTIAGGTYTDALGNGTQLRYDWPRLHGQWGPTGMCPPDCTSPPPPTEDPSIVYQQTPGPVEIIDVLGRTTTLDYCDPVVAAGLPPQEVHRCVVVALQSFIDPEGIRTELQYDGLRNITQARRRARLGSALPDIVTAATYAIANPRAQTKPLTRTDANGNTTDYTYATEHGGLLTETGPAVNGIRPQTRHEYAQRHAWISNGAGGYVQAAHPVWLLAATSTCQSSAATGNPAAPCATAGDEVRTTYDYGPDSGPNNLLLRGILVTGTGVSARTCYGYDALGRRISETGPGAGLASCP